MKKLGRLALIPGIFGINEMVTFGLPVVLNPIIVIPFLLTPLVNITLATLATMWGIIPYTTGASLPWTTPFFFSGWLSTGSILGCLIYFPFFKALDKQYLKEEEGASMLTGDELDDVDLNDLSFDDL